MGNILVTRQQELELPAEVSVLYLNENADYQQGTQSAKRQAARGVQVLTVQMAIVLDDTTAKQIAERILYAIWTERNKVKVRFPRKYAYLEPTDVVNVVDTLSGITHTIRLTRTVASAGGVLEFEGVSEDISTNVQTVLAGTWGASGDAATQATVFTEQTVQLYSLSDAIFADIPLLQDTDGDNGVYVAASGLSDSWRGVVLYRSIDAGVTWDSIDALNVPAKLGWATTVLASWGGGNVFDETNTVTVSVRVGGLSSNTELNVLNWGNAALLGSEIIQFKNATLNGDGTYTLSGLLRGRKGTEDEMYDHEVGDRFLLLEAGPISRMAVPAADLNLERLWKNVTVGTDIVDATAVTRIFRGVAAIPLAPVKGNGSGRQANNDWYITWFRRTRIGGGLADLVDASLGEATEAYQLGIMGAEVTVVGVVFGDSSATITTSGAHGLVTANSFHFYGVSGVWELDDTILTVATTPASNSITVVCDSSSFEPYNFGGRIRKVLRAESINGAINNFTYTAAMQTTDFGGVQNSIVVHVAQMSSVVGRGKSGRWTL